MAEIELRATTLALIELATVLRAQSRAADLVGRMGGDEFVILCPNSDADDIVPLLHRITAALHALNTEPHRDYALATRVGVAVWDTTEPLSIAVLLTAADTSMYENKRLRKVSAQVVAA